MNSDVMHSRVHHARTGLEKDVLERLVTEVKETVATDITVAEPKQTPAFGALHLWNLRRNTRSARNAMRQPRIVTGIGY
jgi:hypothetical protein